MRSEREAIKAIERYSDTVRRLCMIHLKNCADTEDIFQTVFLKYVLSSVTFESEEHEKAWFIRVTINACKDLLKSFFPQTCYITGRNFRKTCGNTRGAQRNFGSSIVAAGKIQRGCIFTLL